MKKLLLSAIALFAATSIFGQTEQGKIMIGATSNLGFTSEKSDVDGAENEVSFNISPKAGYFVIDNLALGLNASISTFKEGNFKSSDLLVGPFARYYFLEGNIKPFIEAEYLFGSSKRESESITTTNTGVVTSTIETKNNLSRFGVSGGASFFLNDNVSIDAILGYNSRSSEADTDGAKKETTSGFGLRVGFSLFF